MGRVFILSVVLMSCVSREVANPNPASNTCTLETKLVPGVPGSPGHLMVSELNPNGVSELASLMRNMVADLTQMKERLGHHLRASDTPMWPRHRQIRCAWPTDPSDRTPAFDAMAQGYLERVKTLDAAPKDIDAYRAVVAGCRACHEQTCAGPLEVIAGLDLP
jgi:hypothetical protein